MPELKSKKTGKTWKDASSFYADAVALDPDLKAHSPQAVWDAYSKDPDYEVGGAAISTPVATQTDIPPAKDTSFSVDTMLSNLPGSFMKQGKETIGGLWDMTKFLGKAMVGSPNDPDSVGNQLYKSVQDNGVGGTLSAGVDKVKAIGSGMYNQKKDFYFGGNFLHNLQEDPAQLIADASIFAGGAGALAKAGGFSRAAKTLSRVGEIANYSSSPIPAVTKAVGQVPAIGNAMAKKGMTYSLKLPPETTIEAGNNLRDFALNNKIDMGMTGRAKAKQNYKRQARTMRDLENSSSADISRADIEKTARDKVAHGNRATTSDLDAANTAVAETLDDPMNFGSQPVVAPSRAANVRKRMNESAAPKPGTIRDSRGSLKAQAEQAVADGTREALGNAIPGHRSVALKAMNFHDAYEAADRVQRGMRNSSLVDHMQTSSLGAPVGNAFRGQLFTPASIGALGKFLHTPEKVSKLAIKAYTKDPKAIAEYFGKTRSTPARAAIQGINSTQKDPAAALEVEEQQNQTPSTGFKRY